MHTDFTAKQLTDPAIVRSNVELNACLQCGYCVDTCPTHQLLGDNLDSPRGRIKLIGEMLESDQPPKHKTVEHLDRCLTCLACMSSCPSSVHYMHLLDHARGHIEENYRRRMPDRLMRWMLARILPYPERFALVLRAARLAKPLAFILPQRMRAMMALTPDELPARSPNDAPQIFHAKGERKRRVALLTGCAQKALNTDINDATIRILCRHGCEVVVAQDAGCCGAVPHHMGRMKESHALGAKNIRAWMKEVNGDGLDAIVINTSGCGTMIKDYGHMFIDHALEEDAKTISALAKDISEVLSDLVMDFRRSPELRVAYHATCSLQFGQRIRFTPKKLLKAAGFTVLEPRNSHTCCGSAGTYSLLQSQISDQLKTRKVKTLEQIAPDVIAAGNIGCMMQIGSGTDLPVVHTVELLDWVTGGPMPQVLDGIHKEAIAAE